MYGFLEIIKSMLDFLYFIFMAVVLIICVPILVYAPDWIRGCILIAEYFGYLKEPAILHYVVLFSSVIVISLIGVVILMYIGAVLRMGSVTIVFWGFISCIIMYSIPIRFYQAAHPTPVKVEAPITMQVDKAVEAYSIP